MNAEPVSAEPVAARRRRIAAPVVAVLALTLLTSACAAGRQAQTADQQPSQDGVNADVGDIALRGISIDAPTGNAYAPGSGALMSIVLVNNGSSTDTLTDISSSSATSWTAYSTAAAATQATTPGGSAETGTKSVAIPAGGRTSFGVPDATGGLALLGTKGTIYPGSNVRLTFTFAHAGTTTVAVPVQLTEDTVAPTLSGAASASS